MGAPMLPRPMKAMLDMGMVWGLGFGTREFRGNSAGLQTGKLLQHKGTDSAPGFYSGLPNRGHIFDRDSAGLGVTWTGFAPQLLGQTRKAGADKKQWDGSLLIPSARAVSVQPGPPVLLHAPKHSTIIRWSGRTSFPDFAKRIDTATMPILPNSDRLLAQLLPQYRRVGHGDQGGNHDDPTGRPRESRDPSVQA